MASNTPKENKMGVMPVKKLIISMALPMMISMLVQALYNVVDSIFVARLGENALSAVTYAFPLQSLMIAVGSGTGVGMNALLSRSLGEKRYENSDAAANTGVLLTFWYQQQGLALPAKGDELLPVFVNQISSLSPLITHLSITNLLFSHQVFDPYELTP